jgi:two-component system chemotaxis response regulator CheY
LREGVRPSVILLDLMMPVMDGYQFVTEKSKDPELADIPVLVVTADGQADQKSRSIGAQGYVRKPFKPSTLIDCIERIAGPASSGAGAP